MCFSFIARPPACCPAALWSPRRVRRPSVFAPPVIDIAAGLTRRTLSAGVLPIRFALTKARPPGCKVICAPDRLVSGHCPPACISIVPHPLRRVQRPNALHRPRSTYPRALPAASGQSPPCTALDRRCRGSFPRAPPAAPHLPRRVRSASALYRTRSACQRAFPAAPPIDVAAGLTRGHRPPACCPAALWSPRHVRRTSVLRRLRSTCQRTLSAGVHLYRPAPAKARPTS